MDYTQKALTIRKIDLHFLRFHDGTRNVCEEKFSFIFLRMLLNMFL